METSRDTENDADKATDGETGAAASDGATTHADSPAARRRASATSLRDSSSRSGSLRSASLRGAGQPSSPVESATSPDARHAGPIPRIRVVLLGQAVFLAAMCAMLFAVTGNLLAKQIAAAASVSGVAASLWLWWLFRDPIEYSAARVTGISGLAMAASFPLVYFFGLFSPAPALLVVGVGLFSLTASARASLIGYVITAIVHGAASAAILAGVLPDSGVITAASLPPTSAVILQILVQGLLAAAHAIGRGQSAAGARSDEELAEARQVIAENEALLLEARYELDRALQTGAPGRHTDRVIGSYRLGNVIGRGAMGEIYEATSLDRDSERREPAAVKLLHPHVLDKPNHVTRFMREAQAARQLDSEHVVTVHDVGQADGVPYMIMERLRGHDLAYYLRSRRMPVDQVVELMRQLGAGLAVARQAGIVHRDIKPQNVFLAERRGKGRIWKILDFGISKLAGSTGTLTKGKVVGTPGYMAPEQARGKNVDYRSDLFALGVIAYRALTGVPPFSGKDMASVLYQVVYYQPRRPSSVAALPEDIDRVLAIALAKNPAERFDSGVALADALALAAESRLDRDLVARAEAILVDHPWGNRVARSRRAGSGDPGEDSDPASSIRAGKVNERGEPDEPDEPAA